MKEKKKVRKEGEEREGAKARKREWRKKKRIRRIKGGRDEKRR